MSFPKIVLSLFSLLLLSSQTHSDTNTISQAVWANEAIIATYTYNYQNFLDRQKEIAVYFTADGWTAYSKALLASKLPDTVKKNSYAVSAVATMPPVVKTVSPTNWQAVMPILVVYKNPQFAQKQTLEVSINFTKAPSGQGVGGYAITNMQSIVKKPACDCPLNPHDDDTAP